MSDGKLHFLPWMRRGLAGALADKAVDGAPTEPVGTVEVSVAVGDSEDPNADTEAVTQSIRLRGPGDVIGLPATQVLRTEPVDGVQDFEPNYFPGIELATPDLPWMFTPATADANHRLVPWLTLVVVTDTDGITLATRTSSPLPVLSISGPANAQDELPSLTQIWAWAHVQTTADLDKSDVQAAFESAPETFLSRLLCPRQLQPDTHYIAALVPTFDEGRRVGLGEVAPDSVDTANPDWWKAWTDSTSAIDLPVYYSWRFRTGSGGDFEALVKRLTPRELDAGIRAFDIGDSGTDRLPPQPPAEKLISWKGALISPAAQEIPADTAHLYAFRNAMRPIVQEGLDRGGEPNAGAEYDPLQHDPVVGPPAYGALASQTDKIPAPFNDAKRRYKRYQPLWLGDANLDPMFRSAGGLGAEIVRRSQESLMASAWQQVSSLGQINNVLNWTRLAAEVAVAQLRKVTGLSDGALLQFAAPAKYRLSVQPGSTLSGLLQQTSLPDGMVSSAFKRVGRPEGPLGRAARTRDSRTLWAPNTATAMTQTFVDDLSGALSYTAYIRPTGLQIGTETLTQGIPGSGDATFTSTPRTDPVVSSRSMRRRRGTLPGARLAQFPETFESPGPWQPNLDVIDVFVPPVSGANEIGEAAEQTRSAIDPAATLSAKMQTRITAPGAPFADGALPGRLSADPEFPDPVYESLRDIDPEFLLPGVGAIPSDTVGLTYVNAPFVEALLLGANEELAREFAWREYPASLGGTWLRVFWEAIPLEGEEDATVEDIPPVAEWNKAPYGPKTSLGTHQIGHGADGTLVLVIKGELLRKYPDTVTYATRARWNDARTADDGTEVAANTMREEAVGADADRRDPVFAGALTRDTVFLGFALTEAEALGDVDAQGAPIPGGDAGWFFVFEEPPAGPRFGLDVGEEADAGAAPAFWRDASWYHQVERAELLPDLSHARADGPLASAGARWYDDPDASTGGKFEETWGAHAAALARITLQRPVRMLVHASAMLPDQGSE